MKINITELQPSCAVSAIINNEINEVDLYSSLRASIHDSNKKMLNEWFSTFIDIIFEKINSNDDKKEFFLDIAALSNARLAGNLQYSNNVNKLNSFLSALSLDQIKTQEGAFAGGLIKYALGDFENAEYYFEKYSTLRQGKPLFHRTAAPFYRNPLKYKITSKNITGTFELEKKSNANSQEIVLVTCESGYLKAYGEDFFNNLITLDSNCSLHIHVINPVENLFSKIGFLNNPNIGLSYEYKNIQQIGTYSALSRYLVAEKIMNDYKKDIIISDIDLNFKTSPKQIMSVVDGSFGLYINNAQGRCFPWTYILAGISVFKNNHSSLQFLRKVSAFNSDMYDDLQNCWMLDQLALEYSFNSEVWEFTDLKTKGLPLSQFSDRPKRRALAKKFLNECKGS